MLLLLLLSIDVNFEVTCALYINDILSSLLGGEYSLVLAREIGDVDVGRKDVETGGGYCHGGSVVFGAYRFTFHLGVVPECTAHTLLPCHLAVGVHEPVHHFVIHKVTTCKICQFTI